MSRVVEVRVPTYKRSNWLRGALQSLLAQDYTDWTAIVFDDDPDMAAAQVVSELADPRIAYRPNAFRMGAAENINQCFESAPLVSGSYAFVLEDDNWIHPDFMSANIACLEDNGLALMHRNQEIWFRGDGEPVKHEGTTLERLYRPGRMAPDEIHAASFLFHGVSNGALFWKTGCRSQLKVPNLYDDPSLHELFRCLAIVEESWFAPEPKAVWADVPRRQTDRQYTPKPIFGAYMRKLRRQAWRRGDEVVMRAFLGAAKRDAYKGVSKLDAQLAYCGIRPIEPTPEAARKRLRGILKSLWFAWPLRHARLDALQPVASP